MMPQATEELRAEWPGGDEEAIRFLESKGFVLRRDWSWQPPAGVVLDERICSAIRYLIDEWDFDGIVSEEMHKRRSEWRR